MVKKQKNGGMAWSAARAADELRRGQQVVLAHLSSAALLIGAQALTAGNLRLLRQEASSLRLVITPERAAALGLEHKGKTVAFSLHRVGAAAVHRLINPEPQPAAGMRGLRSARLLPPAALDAPALSLAKTAGLLPAVVLAPVRPARQQDLVRVRTADIAALARASGRVRAGNPVPLPLAGAEDARVIAFEAPYATGTHLAIVIGRPEKQRAPYVRVHSSCLTGDLLGSLRCDCGGQLQEALRLIKEQKHGVLVYLHQEGRGIGIANKLRAYRLQDAGLDTVEANEHLGYAEDERSYDAAGAILKHLGLTRVALLTNNPAKIDALGKNGIVVEKRLPLALPSNPHNRAYLAAKKKRLGHLL